MIIIETPAPPTRERLVLVRERVIVPESRDATPEDLARAGYVLDERRGVTAELHAAIDAFRRGIETRHEAVLRLADSHSDAIARAEKAERERDEEKRAHTLTLGRLALAEIGRSEADTLRAALARLTAPGEGEPTDWLGMWNGCKIGPLEDSLYGRIKQLYRLGVAHERARQQPEKDLREVSSELEAMRTTHDERERVYVGAIASDEELVTVYRRAAEPLGDEHGEPLRDLMRRCQARGILAVAARVRGERCLVAQAVEANVDIRVCEDDGGGFMVGVHAPDCDEDLERNVPAADVPATLARLLGEVSRG